MSNFTDPRPHRPTRGFTLVELMVVIVIIGILIGVLIPSVSAVRRMARETSTRATLKALEFGAEAFKNDQKFGGFYPPSSSDYFTSANVTKVISPYTNATMSISGAGLLVWALSGADYLGTPGFKPLQGYQYWGACSGNNVGMAYQIKTGQATGAGPKQPRAEQYADKVQTSKSTGVAGQYVIPAETKARGQEFARNYPMYLDAFGYPVLYWRADSAGLLPADNTWTPANPWQRGIYHWLDNAQITSSTLQGASPLMLAKGAPDHKIDWKSGADFSGKPTAATLPNAYQGTFQGYIVNLDVQAQWTPCNPKSFLLASPGADGVYGTADDITNFKHNGQ